ncbi:hypothetical protein AB0346_27850, partial [Nocardia beijingensis]|uniref:hypothetical protein n=1 Tax=Nocardia beijingensis TaxID=95162 RepID=UPI0034504D9C
MRQADDLFADEGCGVALGVSFVDTRQNLDRLPGPPPLDDRVSEIRRLRARQRPREWTRSRSAARGIARDRRALGRARESTIDRCFARDRRAACARRASTTS